MKLNYKRTILVGFAFFLISAFWQAYDATIPVILTNKFGMDQFWSGVVMALDNILALFLLPLFGTLSDKHKGKSGRRTPFIRFGTIAAVILLVALTFADAAQLKQINAVSVVGVARGNDTFWLYYSGQFAHQIGNNLLVVATSSVEVACPKDVYILL